MMRNIEFGLKGYRWRALFPIPLERSYVRGVFFVLALFFSTSIAAQLRSPQGMNYGQSRFFLGGNFGLSFGTISSIYLSPDLSYAATERLYLGGGVSYRYYSNRYYTPYYNVKTWGLRLYGRYFVLDNLFAHVEYQRLYYQDNYYTPVGAYETSNGFYAGGGYRQWFGQNNNGYMTVAILFDLTSDVYVFGINPFIRVGMGVGI